MKETKFNRFCDYLGKSSKGLVCVIILTLALPFNVFSQNKHLPVKRPTPQAASADSVTTLSPDNEFAPISEEKLDSLFEKTTTDTLATATTVATRQFLDSVPEFSDDFEERVIEFNPDPTRAVWLSALFPGLGQIYNRRYWKLPIIVGGYLGLGYATSWNNRMLDDYTRAYRDIMDSDPSTKSYMDFFPKNTKEDELDKTWLTNTLKSRKNFYRRNRDLCIICMVGVYLLAMVDAYVDASLSHFDITPDLSMQVAPALIPDSRDKLPSVGLQWALNF